MIKRSAVRIFMVILILFGISIVTQAQTSSASEKDSQTITREINGKSVRGTLVKWGDSNWALADDGELMLVDGDIGSPKQSLKNTLVSAGIDPALVKSIEFLQNTSASNVDSMFAYLPNLTKVTGLGKLKYEGSAKYMFHTDPQLTSVDLVGFNTSNITSMAGMFNITGISKLDLSSFDTSKVTSMAAMFDDSSKLTELNIQNFDTSNVTDMNYMFWGVPVKQLNVASFNTKSVTNMQAMFDHMKYVVELDLSNFNTEKVTTMEYMFLDSNVQKINLSSFDTQNVINMHSMFQHSVQIEALDLSTFSISDATNTKAMFTETNKLKNLKLGKQTQLKSDMNIPSVPSTDGYTGHWQNVGEGTVEKPSGDHVWTSVELMANFNAAGMGDDTFVWQKEVKSTSTINTGEITDYASDPNLTKYVSTATAPIKPYRYNVIIDKEYPLYSKIDDGQKEEQNTVDLGDKTGATVYNQKNMAATYSGGDKDGKKTNYVQVSFDGTKWYWINQDALNLDLKSRYPSENSKGIALINDMFLGSTVTYGDFSNLDVNSQMVSNAYNENGQIVYTSLAKESDFSGEDDPAKALKTFNDNLDKAAKSWNDSLGLEKPVLVNSSETDAKVTLKVVANPAGKGSATSNGNTGIDSELIKYAMDPTHENYEINLLYITMRHELGHSLGLDHSSNGQYYGMPDNYKFGIDDDVMNAIMVYEPNSWFPWTQKTITENDLSAVKLILANHNFENPQPQTKSVVTNRYVDKKLARMK
ncbi:BspA family leucine-rich repeat surface protein [Pediococcus stilesii]|uniref:BspA family leucine-rich repeat surface protein n=1 Tax=Pediococcus stilesii TaxID=331679 RepID=A0A5R9BU25_9LACO|nr:M57 family metalloprotease [Pediococcus stilesii]TLQ03501.1 BspA family leucine-rich repeat surface protein [Pediococcus stilesii]